MILTPYELEAYFEGDLGEFEERYVLKLIESAERRVAGLCPNARHLMESDAPDELQIGLVRDVVATVVMRVLRDKFAPRKPEKHVVAPDLPGELVRAAAHRARRRAPRAAPGGAQGL